MNIFLVRQNCECDSYCECDVIDFVGFCSDWCHRRWCAHNGERYDGWNGCHEGPDYSVECAAGCGNMAWTV